MIYDIAFNITDEMYFGLYNGNKKHEIDYNLVLDRAYENNVIPFLVGSNYKTSDQCLSFAKFYNTFCYAGIHPNDATKHRNETDSIKEFILANIEKPNDSTYNKEQTNNKTCFFDRPVKNLIAVGECGLDYYRDTSTVEDQKFVFKSLLDLNSKKYFLHSRDAHRDLMEILSDYSNLSVVHSFDGTMEEAKEIIKLGYYIGINGHSVKKIETVQELDMNRVMVESDAPYCKIGKTYEGYKSIRTFFPETKKYNGNMQFKRRNEPVNTLQVVEVLSELWRIPIGDLVTVLEQNTKYFYDF